MFDLIRRLSEKHEHAWVKELCYIWVENMPKREKEKSQKFYEKVKNEYLRNELIVIRNGYKWIEWHYDNEFGVGLIYLEPLSDDTIFWTNLDMTTSGKARNILEIKSQMKELL